MRIKELVLYKLCIPYARPFFLRERRLTHSTHSLVVRVMSEEGVTGYGEGFVNSRLTGESFPSCFGYIEKVVWPSLKNHEFIHLTLLEDPVATLSPLQEVLPEKPVEGVLAWNAAHTAVELALLDCLLKHQDLSFPDVLPPARSPLIYSKTIKSTQIENIAKQALELKLRGARYVKLKIDRSYMEQVKTVRDNIGDEIPLRLDANGRFDLNGAIELCHDIYPYNIHAVEQPMPRGPLADWATLKKNSDVPIMVDESLVTLSDARELIDAQACDFFCLKISKCGGISRTLEIARLAMNSGIRLVLGSHIGQTALLGSATLHVGAYLEQIETLSKSGDILSEDIGKTESIFDRRGLGISVQQHVIDKYAVEKISIRNAAA